MPVVGHQMLSPKHSCGDHSPAQKQGSPRITDRPSGSLRHAPHCTVTVTFTEDERVPLMPFTVIV